MQSTLYLDFETYSEIPIKDGTYKYMEGVEILMCAYAIDDQPAKVWDCTYENVNPHLALWEALSKDSINIVAHNSNFDRNVMRFAKNADSIMQHAGGNTSRWRDTMVKALAHSLPGSLEKLCEIFKLPVDQAKDKEGNRLIQLFCKPLPLNRKLRRATRETHPLEWARFVEYARLDVEAMRALDKKIPNWNYSGSELDLWHLDQRINDRGFAVDTELATSAIAATEQRKKQLAKRTQVLTEGQVKAATQRDALLKHLLEAFGVELPDLKQSTLQRRIDDENLPYVLRELLEIRLQASTTSASKYKTLVKATNKDGRVRGTLQFCGASRTGRWAGRKFQPQNLPRPTLKQNAIDIGIEALKLDCADLLTDDVIQLTSSAVRGCIVAPPGKKLVVADLSNIEGRGLAWLAGEEWKLKAFRDFDAGIGHDLYKLAYAKLFGINPKDVDGFMRQLGKVLELSMGYEGGVGAFVTFAAGYNLDLEDLGKRAYSNIPPNILAEARRAYSWTVLNRRSIFGLSERAWLVCDSFKRMWRYAHPAIVSFWKEIEEACVRAICNPSETYQCRKVKVIKDGAWLRIILPSGRSLCYPGARLNDANKLSYMGVNQYSRKWGRIKTYGGKLAENITQAFSRDILAHSMPHAENAGYEIVLTVHDEDITEAPDTPEFNAKHLSSIMATPPAWALDIPLAAEGFEAYRYRKD